MSDNIPFDMQMEIFKRVSDVKSLIRFRSVSKQWKCFVDSSKFIACYGARRSQPHHLLLRYKEANEVKYVSFLDDVTFTQQQQDFAPNVPLLLRNLNIQKYLEKKDTDIWQVGIFTLSSKTWKMIP
nr:hypothetical protein [Tanacetum cinerariifolium]